MARRGSSEVVALVAAKALPSETRVRSSGRAPEAAKPPDPRGTHRWPVAGSGMTRHRKTIRPELQARAGSFVLCPNRRSPDVWSGLLQVENSAVRRRLRWTVYDVEGVIARVT